MLALWWLLVGATTLTLIFYSASIGAFTAAIALLILIHPLFVGGIPWLGIAALAVLLPLCIPTLRRRLVSGPTLKWFRKVLPPMSDTERDAIEAGTVWWDAELFTGRPDWARLLGYAKPKISAEEQAFLDGPVETLCEMLDDWEISETKDLSKQAWDFIKKERFFSMIIPKAYGGLDFSARAQSEIVMKIATRSPSAAVTIMVPNSLGPGELLMHYGTKEQKDYYLPRLADGREIPCFALTSPYAGSDAGGMPDAGIVCKGEFEGREVLGFRVNWDKRYITLGPVATLLGLAFKAYDPDGLLGDKKNLGITCALIPTGTKGVTIGDRHQPMDQAFMNGPNYGHDVFVPMDWIIGGQPMVGNGWRMLMDCLSAGRGISLPALGVGCAKVASRATGAYARVRKQFRMPIGRFEGIEEVLGRLAGDTYRMDAGRVMTAGALDLGEKPSVISAILKYHLTEGMRRTINDAMDVHAGRGICQGPSNYLGSGYKSVPIAITVEGANILTRSMIIFGQGAIRCHPYLLKELEAASDDDAKRGLENFDRALFEHIGFTLRNGLRSLAYGLTGSRFVGAPGTGPVPQHLRQLTRASAQFAFVADVSLLLLGGELKRRESLSGRLGDLLSHLYLASASIKHFVDQGSPAEDRALLEWAIDDSLYTMERRLDAVLSNFPSPALGWILRRIVFPLGRRRRPPADRTTREAACILMTPSAARDRLTAGMYLNETAEDRIGRVELAFARVLGAEPIEEKIRKAIGKRVEPYNADDVVREALEAGAINDMEAQLVKEAASLTRTTIAVDDFPQAGNATVSAPASPEFAAVD